MGSAVCACGQNAPATPSPAGIFVNRVENLYADLVDDAGVVTTIESGLFNSYQGKDIDWWRRRYQNQRTSLLAKLNGHSAERLSAEDIRALRIMRASFDSTLPANPSNAASSSSASSGRCEEASRPGIDATALKGDLYACFDSIGNSLQFEGKPISRDSAIALLSQLNEPERRKALFLAFTPLWEAINGKNERDSPYRRRVKAAAADAASHGSPIDAVGRDLGLTPAEIERWLARILETWRDVTPSTRVEPWDYRYLAGGADRTLASTITSANLLPIVKRYNRDLGADLESRGVLFDLSPRPGKAPVTYTNYISMGRQVGANWRATTTRVSASFSDSGLYILNMLTHESGHAVHYMAIHTRPAFMDIGDDLFCESFADVTSWNVYDYVWQKKYLGHAVSEGVGLRSQYTMVTLESAWALFELRMLRDPDSDPNEIWTAITSEYFHIIPHPEFSWWAQRVQLVTTPGFMSNYGLGAAVTADIRQHILKALGPFNAGDSRWYPWITRNLLRSGLQFDTSEVLRKFLGRPVSIEPLLEDIRRIRNAATVPKPGGDPPGS